MILRHRERLEGVPVGLDLRALGDGEAELREDVDQLEADLGQQVQVTGGDRARRQGQVDRAREVGAAARVGQRGEARLHRGGDGVLHPVRGLADPRPIGRRQLAELLHHRRDLPLLAEELGLGRAHGLLVVERRDRGGELAGQALELRDQIIGRRGRVHGTSRRAENTSRPLGRPRRNTRSNSRERAGYLAAAAIAWKAAGSLIAISESILRLSEMPALPSVPINFE